jgi:hypothetical protein
MAYSASRKSQGKGLNIPKLMAFQTNFGGETDGLDRVPDSPTRPLAHSPSYNNRLAATK